MGESTGKNLRLSEFINIKDERTLLVDTSIAGCNGYIGELIDASKIIPELAKNCDGIILNPGQLEQLADILPGKRGAAPIVRLDWTNFYREDDFSLPVNKVTRVMICRPEDGLRLGGAAVVMRLLLGFDEDFESENIADMAEVARECSRINIPLIIDVQPIGPKVEKQNKRGAIKLGTGFAVEGGADAVIIPETDRDTLDTLLEFSSVPLIIRTENVKLFHINEDKNGGSNENNNCSNDIKTSKQEILSWGINGYCLGKELYKNADKSSVEIVKKMNSLIHDTDVIQGSED